MTANLSEVITFHHIKVIWPYGDVRLQHVEMTQGFGEHARLLITGYMNEEYEEKIINSSQSGDLIELWRIQDDGQEIPLFMGQLYCVDVQKIHNNLFATIHCVSHSFKLDTQLKSRSFQQVNYSYSDIVKRILNEYSNSDMLDEAFGKQLTGKFIMQYQESDWTFIKRLASHVGAIVVPNITAHRIQFWIGIPQGRRQISLNNVPLQISRNIANYIDKTINGAIRTSPDDFTRYSFEWDEILGLGDEVYCDHKIYVIISRKGSMVSGVMKWSYECALPGGMTVNKVLNPTIIGAAIEGKILEINRNQVRIHLDMDEQQNPNEARWFPYSAEGNQVWYLMPEKGTQIKLYFPSADEDDAMVIQSVRKQPKRPSSISLSDESKEERYDRKMSDPGVKSISNPQGKELVLGDSELNITADEGMLYISMNSANGVSLNSTQTIQIQAKGGLELKASHISIHGEEGLEIRNRYAKLRLDEEIDGYSTEIQLSGTTHNSYPKLLSPFEQKMADMGIGKAIADQMVNNVGATLEGVWDGTVDFAKDLGNFVLDIGDIAFSYSQGVTSERFLTLYERNDTMRGTTDGLIQTGKYTNDLVTLKKSFKEIYKDGESAFNSYSAPIKERVSKFLPNPLTDTREESYQMGYSSIEASERVLDTVGVFIGGAGLIKNAPKIFKSFVGKTNASGLAKLGDGKLKTNALRSPKGIENLDDLLRDAARKMNQDYIRDGIVHKGGADFWKSLDQDVKLKSKLDDVETKKTRDKTPESKHSPEEKRRRDEEERRRREEEEERKRDEEVEGTGEGAAKVISEADRAKLSGWKYPPSDELYLEYKNVYDNPKYYNQETGDINWPGTNGDPNIDGFVNGEFKIETLQSGIIIDRYGSNPSGQYFSPAGSSYGSRALPPHMKSQPYTKYIVEREFEVKSGSIAPWFDEVGEGVQYYSQIEIVDEFGTPVKATVQNLLDLGYIKEFIE